MSSTTFYNSQSLVGIGSVGIGTTNPRADLHVNGDGTQTKTGQGSLQILSSGGLPLNINYSGPGASTNYAIYSVAGTTNPTTNKLFRYIGYLLIDGNAGNLGGFHVEGIIGGGVNSSGSGTAYLKADMTNRGTSGGYKYSQITGGTIGPGMNVFMVSNTSATPNQIDFYIQYGGSGNYNGFNLDIKSLWSTFVFVNIEGTADPRTSPTSYSTYWNLLDSANFTQKSSTGNVGIGTTNPQTDLHVSGSTLMTNDTIYNGASGWYNIGLWDCTASQNAGAHLKLRILGCYGYNGGNVSGVQAGGETTIYLTNLNNANSGTVNVDGWWKHEGGATMFTSVKVVSSGSSRFQYNIWVNVQGNTNHAINAETTAGTIWTSQYISGSDPGVNSATVQLIVLSTAAVGTNVGIGMTDPNYKLTANSTPGITAFFQSSVLTNGQNNSIGIGKTNSNYNCGTILWNHVSDGSLTNYLGLGAYGADNKLNIRGDGRVGIGTQTPSCLLDIYSASGDGTARVSANADSLLSTEVTNDTNYAYVQFKSNTGGTPKTAFICLTNSTNSNRLFFANGPTGTANGPYLARDATNFTAGSDARLKNIIEPVSNAISKIEQINPCIYYLKNDETLKKRRIGVIAQDVYKVLPEAVDSTPDSDIMMGVQYNDLIPLTIAAIKELSAENTALKTQMTSLESRLAALEARLDALEAK